MGRIGAWRPLAGPHAPASSRRQWVLKRLLLVVRTVLGQVRGTLLVAAQADERYKRLVGIAGSVHPLHWAANAMAERPSRRATMKCFLSRDQGTRWMNHTQTLK